MARKTKTIEAYELEIKTLAKERDSLNRRITFRRNKINALKDEKFTIDVSTVPADDITKLTVEQWKMMLYHWHDQTTLHYTTTSNFLMKHGVWTSGIAGTGKFDCKVRQHYFSIHNSHNTDKFKELYLIAKDALKDWPSRKDDTPIIEMGLLVNMFRESYDHYGHRLEIRKEDDMCRFIDAYSTYKEPTDWMPLDTAFDEIKKYQTYEIDDDDDDDCGC